MPHASIDPLVILPDLFDGALTLPARKRKPGWTATLTAQVAALPAMNQSIIKSKRAEKEQNRQNRLDAQQAFMREHTCRKALPSDFTNERFNRS